MTIKDLWDKMLTLDLIPLFEFFAVSFISALVIIAVVLGGMAWWLHRRGAN